MAATNRATDRFLIVHPHPVDGRGVIAPAGNLADGHPETRDGEYRAVPTARP